MTKHDSHSKAATQPSITNADRGEYAAYALDQYGLHKEGRADYDRPEDMAADLISDLLHLIRAHDVEDPFANARHRTDELRRRRGRGTPPGLTGKEPRKSVETYTFERLIRQRHTSAPGAPCS